MAELLTVPLKKSSDVELVKPLRNLIAATHENSQDFTEALNEFDRLRSAAVWKVFDKTSLDVLYNYYDQLISLESKVPPQEVQIPFKWKDAFDKGSFFAGRMSLTVSSLSFERICILFNMAAVMSALAASQALDTEESLKQAAKLLQQAAGIFSELKGSAVAAVAGDPTPDLSPDSTHALSALMLAQAQEIIAYKCIRDEMSAAAVSKVCAGAGELFGEAARALAREQLRPLWDRDWLTNVHAKQNAFNGAAQYYAGVAAGEKGAVGEQISRLQAALDSMKAAGSLSQTLQEVSSKAGRQLASARKDNDFIYHERIPELSALPAIQRAVLAKPIPVQRKYTDKPDLFSSLPGVAGARRVTELAAARSAAVAAHLDRARQATQTLNGILTSLNLAGCVEAAGGGGGAGGGGAGEALRARARAVREAGGLSALADLMTELPDLLQRNRDILNESERMLREEEEADESLRAQFGSRWTRTASKALTDTFRANADKYRQIIDNAVRADAIVREKFEQHKQSIEVLCGSDAGLDAALPAAAAADDPAALQDLRDLCHQVEELKRERSSLEEELKNSTTELRDALVATLQSGGSAEPDSEALVPLGPLAQRLQASLDRQDVLLHQIQEAHSSYAARAGGAAAAAGGGRAAAAGALCAASDAYHDLTGNLKEGVKFYNDLTQLLVAFQNKVSDFCFARRTEKEELLKDLTQDASRASHPAPPASEQPVVARREPPPRPAPPAPAPAQGPAPGSAPAPAAATLPYPTQPQGMPVPYGVSAPYPYYAPMPATYNPYATLPYPHHARLPAAPLYQPYQYPYNPYQQPPQPPPQ